MPKKLDKLKFKVKNLAEELVAKAKEQGIDVGITQGLRTIKEQDALYAKGRTKPGKIVTRAKGGYSAHNYGVAFDFVPLVDGKPDWKDLKKFEEVGKLGEELGLEWGGGWTRFKDRPHLQYLAGHTIKDFREGKVDEKKFE